MLEAGRVPRPPRCQTEEEVVAVEGRPLLLMGPFLPRLLLIWRSVRAAATWLALQH
jgi:hypothetical protein